MAAPDGTKQESDCSSDSFAQVNATLIDRGCLTKPLDLDGISSTTKKALAQLLISLLGQRQDDANFREQLSSKLKVAESSLERTKRFWSEEQSKSADLARRLETSKARVSSTTQELTECQSNLKRTKDELQKSKRDLLSVKQQAHQQRQANERQLERLRAKFSDESIKLLRSKVPDVQLVTRSTGLKSSQGQSEAGPSRLQRKQIDELERRRKELFENNIALKKYATESLSVIREVSMNIERTKSPDDAIALSSSSSSNSSTSAIRPTYRLHNLQQQDLFPPSLPLPIDYTLEVSRGKKQHPAVQALNEMTTLLRENASRLKESPSSLATSSISTQDSCEDGASKRTHDLLDKAMQRVQELENVIERSKKESVLSQSRKEDREERFKQAAEVEKQRQRYLTLCKELEKQEEALRSEKMALQSEREEIMKTELSLSMQAEDSNVSLVDSDATISPIKRGREEDKENEMMQTSKKSRIENHKTTTPRENTMRFVTMRKQRLRLQS